MKKQITIMLGIILALPLVFAMIAGTNETIEFSDVVSDCYIYNNQSDLIGLNLTEEGSNVIISTDIRYKPDTFIVSCLVRGSREEAQESSGGGGYYTYPWRNKVNQTVNETNQTENLIEAFPKDKIDSVAIEETEEISEESKIRWVWIIAAIFVLIAITLIIKIIMNKKTQENQTFVQDKYNNIKEE